MSGALDGHPIVAAILADRARAISTDPSREAIVLVAHGPVNDEENQQWLNNLGVLASGIRKDAAYASIDWMTVRDDAPKPIRDAATAELRALVTKRRESGARVLIVPGTALVRRHRTGDPQTARRARLRHGPAGHHARRSPGQLDRGPARRLPVRPVIRFTHDAEASGRSALLRRCRAVPAPRRRRAGAEG